MKAPRVKSGLILERTDAFGTYDKGLVQVDSRLMSFCYLETLCHEMLHHYCPKWKEKRVLKVGKQMARILWKHRFRRVEK